MRGSGVEPGEGGGELSEDVRQRVSQGRRLHLWRLPLETASQRTGATGGFGKWGAAAEQPGGPECQPGVRVQQTGPEPHADHRVLQSGLQEE